MPPCLQERNKKYQEQFQLNIWNSCLNFTAFLFIPKKSPSRPGRTDTRLASSQFLISKHNKTKQFLRIIIHFLVVFTIYSELLENGPSKREQHVPAHQHQHRSLRRWERRWMWNSQHPGLLAIRLPFLLLLRNSNRQLSSSSFLQSQCQVNSLFTFQIWKQIPAPYCWTIPFPGRSSPVICRLRREIYGIWRRSSSGRFLGISGPGKCGPTKPQASDRITPFPLPSLRQYWRNPNVKSWRDQFREKVAMHGQPVQFARLFQFSPTFLAALRPW